MSTLKKPYQLVKLLAFVQLACLGGGLFVFTTWISQSIRTAVHQQTLSDNVLVAQQLTKLVREMQIGDVRNDATEWERMQGVVRDVRLPNAGYVCLVDSGDGGLICHPALQQPPSSSDGPPMWKKWKEGMPTKTMPSKAMAAKPMNKKPMMVKSMEEETIEPKPAMVQSTQQESESTVSKPMMPKPMVKEPTNSKPMMAKSMVPKPMMKKPLATSVPSQTDPESETPVTGSIVGKGPDLEVVAAAEIPSWGARLLVHQMGAGIDRRVAGVMGSIVVIGLTVVAGVVASTTAILVWVIRHYDDRLRRINGQLERRVDQRTRALRKTRDAVIFGLAKLAESRDTDTGEHLERISTYTTLLAKQMRNDGIDLDPNLVSHIGLASSLHDIGKVGVADRVLLKPGRLDPDERSEMETHAARGGDCLAAISDRLGEDDFLQLAKEIAYAHHEKWDGSGYPAGLAGEGIPLGARIVALADVYDALRSRRPYKEPMPHEKARSILLEGRGSHFDPVVIEAFLACEQDFIELSNRSNATSVRDHVDGEAPSQPAMA